MHALVLIAHGSRREASNREVRSLAAKLAQTAGERFGMVAPAFLELAEPDIQSAVDQCAAAGADQLTVIPYFLAAGRHVVEDIPMQLQTARSRHPRIRIRHTDYFGMHGAIPDMLLTLAQQPLAAAQCRMPACEDA